MLCTWGGMTQAQTKLPEGKYYSCDTNQDGTVDITDVTNTVNAVLGKTAVNGMVCVPGNTAVSDKIASYQAILSKLDKSVPKTVNANGHEYVDLGLSVYWAKYNVGANMTSAASSAKNSTTGQYEYYGQYYAWGETKGYGEKSTAYPSSTQQDWRLIPGYTDNTNKVKYPACMTSGKKEFSWDTYKWGTSTSRCFKYYESEYQTLGLNDDPAFQNMGGDWCTPTKEEFDELMSKTYMKYDSNYRSTGVAGYIFFKPLQSADAGKVSNNRDSYTPSQTYSYANTHIFIPCNGYIDGTTINTSKGGGNYWTSSSVTSLMNNAYIMSMGPSAAPTASYYWRYCGYGVRGVMRK